MAVPGVARITDDRVDKGSTVNSVPVKTLWTVVSVPVEYARVAVPDVACRTSIEVAAAARITWYANSTLLRISVVAHANTVNEHHVRGANASISTPD